MLSEKRKILIFSLWEVSISSIGGTEKYTKELAECLVQEGFEVDVIMLSGQNYIHNQVNYISLQTDLISEIEISNFITPFSISKLGDFEEFVLKLICQFVDIKSYRICFNNTQLFSFENFFEKKCISILHTNPQEFTQMFGKYSFDILSKIMNKKLNTIFVAPSFYYSELYKTKYNIDCKCIEHSIDFEYMKELDRFDKKVICQKYKINISSRINLVVPSRLEIIQKRQDFLLESLSDCNFDYSKVNIIFTGIDTHYLANIEILKKLVPEDSHQNLYFLNFTDIREALFLADIIVLPSQTESFGYSALESLFTNKPILLSDIPTFLEIGKNQYGIYFFETYNPKDLFNKLEKIIFELKDKNIDRNLNSLGNFYSQKTWINKYLKLIC